MKRIILLHFSFALLIIMGSCGDDNIVIPTPCTEAGYFPYSSVTLELYTNIYTASYIKIFPNGHLEGDSIKVKNDNSLKTVRISGTICKDYNAVADIMYTDTADYSRLRIETYLTTERVMGKIYWCPNVNNQCTFIQIGNFSGLIGGNHGGTFTTPLFIGSYRAYLK